MDNYTVVVDNPVDTVEKDSQGSTEYRLPQSNLPTPGSYTSVVQA